MVGTQGKVCPPHRPWQLPRPRLLDQWPNGGVATVRTARAGRRGCAPGRPA